MKIEIYVDFNENFRNLEIQAKNEKYFMLWPSGLFNKDFLWEAI